MTRKNQRIFIIIIGLISLFLGVGIILYNFTNNIIFFLSPSQLYSQPELSEKIIRVGGLIKEGSILKGQKDIEFVLTDLENSVKVRYIGIVPNLLREGQGMVAKGYIRNDIFEAEELLVKHDEKYMPKEVSNALKKSGRWQEN